MSLMAVVEGNEIKYHVMDPTGNITILVETPVEEASQPFIAAELMHMEPDAEQVGFLTIPEGKSAGMQFESHTGDQRFWDIALRMAGGEFCGNATMSAAAFYAARNNIREGTVTVRVSGAAEPVPVEICLAAEASALSENGPVYRGTVTMPCPVAITEVKLPDYDPEETDGVYPVVHFEGIDHVILGAKPAPGDRCADHMNDHMNRVRAEELAPLWCRELQAEAVGLMFLNRSEGTLTPLVYVPEAGTLVWENSCASGTSAVGAWAASRLQTESADKDAAYANAVVQPENPAGKDCVVQPENPAGKDCVVQPENAEGSKSVVHLSLQEPGGNLRVEVSADGVIRLTGTVRERQ